MNSPTIGLYLPPDHTFQAIALPAFRRCGHLEVVPESLWTPTPAGFQPNGFHRIAQDLQQSLGVPIVAHGTLLNPCGSGPNEPQRRALWLERIEALHQTFQFPWYTEHLGACIIDGTVLTLPTAVPWTTEMVQQTRTTLDELAGIVPMAGLENSAFYVDPADDAGFLSAACAAPHHFLLDVTNLAIAETNLGIDVEQWLGRAPLHRCIEIHVAGGSASDPCWLPSKSRYALDSHDARVPDRAWQILEHVLPRVPALRAITLERLEGTLTDADLPGLLADLDGIETRLKHWAPSASPPTTSPSQYFTPEGPSWCTSALATALLSREPGTSLPPDHPWLLDPDGLTLTARLVMQLRFGRLLQGSSAAANWFDADPQGFTEVWSLYHHEVRPEGVTPEEEANDFQTWLSQEGDPPG